VPLSVPVTAEAEHRRWGRGVSWLAIPSRTLKNLEQRAQLTVGFQRVAEMAAGVNLVAVAPPLPVPAQNAAGLEISDDALSSALRDADALRYVTQPGTGILRQGNEDVAVVA